MSLLPPKPLLVPVRRGDALRTLPAVESQQLLGGAREVLIRHGDQTYRLCHTRNDKLILVK